LRMLKKWVKDFVCRGQHPHSFFWPWLRRAYASLNLYKSQLVAVTWRLQVGDEERIKNMRKFKVVQRDYTKLGEKQKIETLYSD
jgi:hypothetical protein